ncbi:MAG: transcriptional regulator BetI [Paracoccaceae bacterium]|nr:transcriptional regulator BetI [Paracoccaceae bacterium]MDE3123513.1 transcriptional regulator BetI [Paracoccaceae bacterium]MDE3238281.1 transcriptional regulator BetI [Paracoccaceae bacterium]
MAEVREGAGRKASKETRRRQLIEATIDSLARRGYAETTLAHVAEGAGLSAGIVNFHFESKEKLFVATLTHLADEYTAHWQAARDRAGETAAERLWAIVQADFDPRLATRRKLAAWCAFWGEAKSRPTYQALCGARDDAYQREIEGLLARIAGEAQAAVLAEGLCALLEGLWFRLMMNTGLTRDAARQAAVGWLVAAFPDLFAATGPRRR